MAIFHRSFYVLCCIIVTLTSTNSFAVDNYTKWETKVTTDSVGSSRRIEITGNRKVIVEGRARDVSSKLLDYKPNKTLFGRLMSKRVLANGSALAVVPVAIAVLRRYGYMLDDGKFIPENNGNKWRWTCGGKWYTNPVSMYPCLALNKKNLLEAGVSYSVRVDITGHTIDPNNGTLRYTYTSTRSDTGYTSSPKTDIEFGSPNTNPATPEKPLTDTEIGEKLLNEILNPTSQTTQSEIDTLVNSLTPQGNETINDSEIFRDISKRLSDPKNENFSDTDTTVTGQTSTGDGGNSDSIFNLPKFCDWATSVCSFIDWFKDDSAIPEPEQYDIQEFDKTKLPTDPQFNFNGQCPAPKTLTLNLGMASTEISLSYDYFCSFAIDIRPFVILAAWLHACYIFAGYVRS